MNRKMLLSVLVIVIVAAALGGATMAWFSDTAESEAVEFQAGTLLIDIDSSDFFELEGLDRLNPGDDFEWDVTVCNEGTKNLIYKIVICWDDILGNTLHDFGEREGYGTDPLSNAIVFTITKDGEVLTRGTLENETSPLDYEFELPLAPGVCDTFNIRAEFPSGSGNEYQGSMMRAAFAALAKQVHEDAEFPEFECPLEPYDPDLPETIVNFPFDSDEELTGWYVDRAEPYAFELAEFGGDWRLKHSINESDAPSNDFYQYQGMKHDTPGATYFSIDLYIPTDWGNSNYVRAGMWATGSNGILSYPIIEFTNNDSNPRFRVWQSNTGWVDKGLPAGFTYNEWYTLEIELDVDSEEITYTVGDITHVLDSQDADQFINVILQGHNPTPDGANYDIYWDNFLAQN